jgi:hypothetical protein
MVGNGSEKETVAGIAFVIPLTPLRNTPGAMSPLAPGSSVARPWYMHPDQEDNLLVVCGMRRIELYTKEHGAVDTFEVMPEKIMQNGSVIHEGPAIVGWGTHVFHRVVSPEGSIALNFARHFKNFSIDTNFNIYDLDTETGSFDVIREGYKDQPIVSEGE